MAITPSIRELFGRFQNLNLLVLLEDLRQNRTARRGWSSDGLLCPVAHGLPDGYHVRGLNVLGQAANLGDDCDYAARCLGVAPIIVLRFVRSWDELTLNHDWLLQQLEELWLERVTDAEAVQAFFHSDQESLCEQLATNF